MWRLIVAGLSVVIDIDKTKLPSPQTVNAWTGRAVALGRGRFAAAWVMRLSMACADDSYARRRTES